MRKRIVPLDLIPRDARLIKFGAGKNGKNYIEQLEKLGWCRIVGVVDTYNSIQIEGGIKTIPIEMIDSIVFDYILISIVDKKERMAVRENLMLMGVEANAIIYQIDCFVEKEDILAEFQEEKRTCELEIALDITGGMGDVIIELSVLQDIYKNVPNASIDVYTADKGFEDSIFWGQKGLRKLYKHHIKYEEQKNYDVV